MVLGARPWCLLAAAGLASCNPGADGVLAIAIIDSPEALFANGNRLSAGGQLLRAATATGLVTLDADGEVVPALADSWIVTDDGRSFIFRLREGTWPDGKPLTAETARSALNDALRSLRGTSLGLDLTPITQVRAMAGRVVEIRLSSPQPNLLQLLAQPELALVRDGAGNGAMAIERAGEGARLTLKPPQDRGLPEDPDWQAEVRTLQVTAQTAAQAVQMFDEGAVDLVIGGGLDAFPLAPTGPLSRGTVRLDPAIGLFGLQVKRAEGLLATAGGREALSMAIDRPALVAPFNLAGWVPTTRLVAPDLPDDAGLVTARWDGIPPEGLRAQAARRVAQWRAGQNGAPATITLALARAPGNDRLYSELTRQLALVGIVLKRVELGEPADLVLVDRVARYAGPRWFLNQFACTVARGPCLAEADALVAESLGATEPATRARLLAEAEANLTLANLYIPFGSPLRWSLVRSNVDGFAANVWAFHPLPALAAAPR